MNAPGWLQTGVPRKWRQFKHPKAKRESLESNSSGLCDLLEVFLVGDSGDRILSCRSCLVG